MQPTSDPFAIQFPHLPHGFSTPQPEDRRWFQQNVNSDIRYYYRLIRKGTTINPDNPVGRSGITVGELALYIIRENHTKRRKRY